MVLEFNNTKRYNNTNCGIPRLFSLLFEGNIVDSETNNKLSRKQSKTLQKTIGISFATLQRTLMAKM